MAIYAVGDIQGCLEAFQKLLDQIRFEPAQDRLWLVGDLVNRGPDSLGVMRFVKQMGDRAITVLGNHDLHLLVVAEGSEKPRRKDTLGPVLSAPDREELLAWMRSLHMMHAAGNFAMVHAGLLPQWTLPEALLLAREVEAALRGPDYQEFLAHMYGNRPNRWDESLEGFDRLRVIANAMTRMRVCSEDGVMDFEHKGRIEHAPAGFMPWFEVPNRRSRDTTIVCGHWSALGLRVEPDVIVLDSGCLWGGALSAVRLEDRRVFQVPCRGMAGVTHGQ